MDERNRDAGLTAWIALVEAHAAAVESVEADLVREAGLPLSWHEVLVRLSRTEEQSMRMQELAKAVLLSKSGLTRLADRMEAAGLIERTACDSDRRGTWAVITPKGRETLTARRRRSSRRSTATSPGTFPRRDRVGGVVAAEGHPRAQRRRSARRRT